MRLSRRHLWSLVTALVVVASGVTAIIVVPAEPGGERAEAVAIEVSTTTTTTTTVPTTLPPPTTPPPPPTTVASITLPPAPPEAEPDPPPAAAFPDRGPLPVPGTWTVDAYSGLGAWLDVYDWSETFGGAAAGLDDIDRMATLGVQTLYLQPVRWDVETDILEYERVLSLIERARARGIRVVAWYLPDLRDPGNDLRHLAAIAALPVDGLGVDIESRTVEDVDQRNRSLIDLSAALRQALPGQALSAIVLPPVVMEDVNPNYWPGHPWAELAPYYDVWQPMGYWTNRVGDWRDAYWYTAENIDRVRAHIGRPDAIVHPIGGIGDETTPEDIAAMVTAAQERGCVGGSIYDYRTTGDHLWPSLQAFIS